MHTQILNVFQYIINQSMQSHKKQQHQQAAYYSSLIHSSSKQTFGDRQTQVYRPIPAQTSPNKCRQSYLTSVHWSSDPHRNFGPSSTDNVRQFGAFICILHPLLSLFSFLFFCTTHLFFIFFIFAIFATFPHKLQTGGGGNRWKLFTIQITEQPIRV